jgi:hypothetical protein
MLEVFLKSPGIPFRKPNGNVIRTPIKFNIDESERQLYESLIRVSSIQDFEIKKVEKPIEKKKTKVPKLSLRKPITEITLGLKIQN